MTSFFDNASGENTKAIQESDDALYRHAKRPQWGVAIHAWGTGDVRAYQFEDGRLRKFKKGYFQLLEPVEEIRGSRESVVANLRAAAKLRQTGPRDIDPLEPAAPFEDQVKLFLELYPKGFEDEQWVADHRGTPTGSDLKRHRDPIVRAVKESLAAEYCREMLHEDRHEDIVEVVQGILASTDLVALKSARMLKGLDPEESKAYATAVVDLLHGEDEFRPRFRGYLRVLRDLLGSRPAWRFATAVPALAFPQDQVCVRHSAFKRQAGSIAPRARYSRRARTGPYENYRRVAFEVRDRLTAAGHEPRDMLDVYDFVWATLRRAALEHLGD